jgi:hypothetical protein
VTEKNGDDDNQIFFNAFEVALFEAYYEKTVSRVALGNLFLQKDIESARKAHVEIRAQIKAIEERLEIVAEELAPPPHKRSSPPASAALLLAFIAPKHSAQALLGDLEEMFQKNADRFGEDRARRLYWFEVARSIGPLVWQWVKRMGFITLLVDYFRSKFGL